MTTKLSADAVENLFAECMSDEGREIEGVSNKTRLDVTGKEAAIADLLNDLPDEFQAGKGGGWSFLNACMTKHGEQWTGLHRTMEKLFMLGIASGKAKWLMPREMWDVLPGGMPYVVVNT